jgi:hypothetical protein
MRRKLLTTFALPAIILFAVFGFVAMEVTRRDLDAELGARLSSVAATAATQLRGKYLAEIGEGNETDRSYLSAVSRLQAIEKAADVQLLLSTASSRSRRTPSGPRSGPNCLRLS